MIINKLKRLLKAQMEKGDALRKESRSTIEKLREEFDSLVKEFMLYKKNETGNKKNSKSYVPDLGAHKPTEIERNLGPVLAEGSIYHHKNNDNNQRDSDAKKRGNRESYEDVEEMDMDYNAKEEGHGGNERSNPPFVPLLSLGKIADK